MSNHNMELKQSTLCMHANHKKNQYGAVVQPIYQTSTFQFDTCDQGGNRFAGKEEGYVYTRIGNPTTDDLEARISILEKTEACAATSSGMGAIATTFLSLLNSGDHIISDDTLYGCTHCLLEKQLTRFGIEVTFINSAIPGEVKKNLKPNTKIVYFETPANPTLKIIDIERVSKEAHSQEGVLVMVDNTFCSPILSNPKDFGADIIVHSASKYINGHSDIVAGLICSTKEIIKKVKMNGLKDITGATMSPHDAWLIIRGINTLSIRMEQICKNTIEVAKFLKNHPAIESVIFPGFEEHEGHEIAKKQMKMFGGMISFIIKGGLESGKKFLDNLNIITLAVSLGGCETLIQQPSTMTHACVPRKERIYAGIEDGLIRISVGIENINDIIYDLKQSLDHI